MIGIDSLLSFIKKFLNISNMSRFTEFTSVQIPNKSSQFFRTMDVLRYEKWYEWSGNFILVPAWFETNFASIPFFLQIFFSPTDYRWIIPSILHDYLFSKAKTLNDFSEANIHFSDACVACGTPTWIANVFYIGVTIWWIFYWIKKLIKGKNMVD